MLAADVAGYSRLMGADEEGTLAALTLHVRSLIRPAVEAHGGRVVKTTGDGLLAEFPSVVDAVRCALEWQEGVSAREAERPAERRILFRIGINLGDVIEQDGDIYGDGVNIAARMEGLADPGGICVSGTVYDHLHGKLEASFTDLGPKPVKNIGRPVHAYRIAAAVPEEGTRRWPPARWRGPGRGRPGMRAALAAGLLLIAAGALAWWQLGPDAGSDAGGAVATVASAVPSVAVLPFLNLSDDPEQEYFADGITEDIIVELSKNSALQVIGRNSAFPYKRTTLDAGTVAGELGVRYLLTGSVRRDGSRLRVNAELTDSATGRNLWADRFDRRAEDIFAVQDEISAGIIGTLATQVTRAEIERMRRKPPATLDAYDNYLRGLELFRQRATRPPWGRTLSDSRTYLQRAVELDPGFGLAWSALAENYVSSWIQKPRYAPLEHEHQNPQTLEKAVAAAQQAIAVDPRLADGYAKLGWVLHWMRRPEEAQAAYRRAFEINPNLLDDAYPNALVKFGRHEEAIAYLQRQVRLEPSFGRNYGNLGLAQYMAGAYAEAIGSLRTCQRMAEGWRACRIWMAAALAQLGRLEEASAEVAAVRARDPGFSVPRYVDFEPYARREDAQHLAEGLIKAGFSS